MSVMAYDQILNLNQIYSEPGRVSFVVEYIYVTKDV